MSDILFLRIGADVAQGAEWLRSGSSAVQRGSLADAAVLAADATVVVFVPSEDVLLTGATIPVRGAKRLRQALPFALEEQVATEIEALHFALGAHLPGGEVAAAVTSREAMGGWLSQLEAAGIRPRVMMPEVLAVPRRAGEWSLLCLDENAAVLRTGDQQGASLDRDNLSLLLRMRRQEAAESAERRLRLLGCDFDEIERSALATETDMEIVRDSSQTPPLLRLAQAYDPKQAINLLQGDYASREPRRAQRGQWAIAAALFVAWGLVHITGAWIENHKLADQLESLRGQVVQTYREAFPDARNVPQPRLQMERRLASLGGESGEHANFLGLLDQVGAAFAGTGGIEIDSASYRREQLDLQLALDDLRTLDALKQQLAGDRMLKVDVQSATAQGSKVRAHLRIRSSGS